MIYFKSQHPHSSRKLPRSLSRAREEMVVGKTMYLPTIFCVVFQLRMLSAVSNRKSNSWMVCSNFCYLCICGGKQFQDLPRGSTVINFHLFVLPSLQNWLFIPMWSQDGCFLTSILETGGAELCLESKCFSGREKGSVH
jgi:hypothetical protein